MLGIYKRSTALPRLCILNQHIFTQKFTHRVLQVKEMGSVERRKLKAIMTLKLKPEALRLSNWVILGRQLDLSEPHM